MNLRPMGDGKYCASVRWDRRKAIDSYVCPWEIVPEANLTPEQLAIKKAALGPPPKAKRILKVRRIEDALRDYLVEHPGDADIPELAQFLKDRLWS